MDGLTPGAHGLAIHETGDVSRFYIMYLKKVSNILVLGCPNFCTSVVYEIYNVSHIQHFIHRGCASLGGHFNPRGTRHGSPEFNADKRHVSQLR